MKDLYETQSNLELNTGYTPLCCEVIGPSGRDRSLSPPGPRTAGTGAGADPLGEGVPAQAAVQRDDTLFSRLRIRNIDSISACDHP